MRAIGLAERDAKCRREYEALFASKPKPKLPDIDTMSPSELYRHMRYLQTELKRLSVF